eukprot:SAG22_NODE_149_length_17456_cov_5.058363_5_plen_85_part_00
MYSRALTIREAKLPKLDPRTAATMHNLGSVYKELRDYPRALELLNRALEIRTAAFGPTHRDTLATADHAKALAKRLKPKTVKLG